jgi:2-oxoglutarate ferredoxin oxidoreductase subunit alpha
VLSMTAAPARRQLVTGNRMVALGALDAGCRFFSGYPITPSNEIYSTMMDELPRLGGLGVASPDEISAICQVVGASMTGCRAMTATSGPGWCLMIETVQYAVMTETPVVVAVVQRLGPSTGGATQGGQGDVLLTEFCTSGGYTIPVFAPSDGRECYELTQQAFAWSERLRTPVVLLSDKEVGMTLESIDTDKLKGPGVHPRKPFEGDPARFATYRCDCPDEPPPFAHLGGTARVVATGSAHDAEGRLRKNAPEVLEVLARLQTKIASHTEEMAFTRLEAAQNPETLVISFGISARASREACRRLRSAGYAVSFLQLKTLFPIPALAIRQAAEGCRRVVVVEENMTGLYGSIIEPLLGGRPLVRVNAIGRMIPPDRIETAVREARPSLEAKGSERSAAGPIPDGTNTAPSPGRTSRTIPEGSPEDAG